MLKERLIRQSVTWQISAGHEGHQLIFQYPISPVSGYLRYTARPYIVIQMETKVKSLELISA